MWKINLVIIKALSEKGLPELALQLIDLFFSPFSLFMLGQSRRFIFSPAVSCPHTQKNIIITSYLKRTLKSIFKALRLIKRNVTYKMVLKRSMIATVMIFAS